MQASHSKGLELNFPQSDFIHCKKPFRGFCGGYRSGKTFIGCVRLWQLASMYPGIKLGYFAPTYPHVRDIFYDTIEEVADLYSRNLGVPCSIDINKSEHLVTMFINGIKYATVKCKSMDQPYAIVGFDINHALVDEIDCMKKEKADAAWKKIVARLSSSGFDEQRLYDEEMNLDLVIEALQSNTVDFTTTPEGFNWMYEFFVKQLRERPELGEYYELVKASTRQNAKNLPDDYIDKLYKTYPSNLVDAYIDGEFVNLTRGSVYVMFDRKENRSIESWDGKEPLHIGMDFNVGRMCCVAHVIRNGIPHAVAEITGGYDTPEMVKLVKRRFWKETGADVFEKTCQIYVYPDSSGKNRKSVGASETDISLLNSAGFMCMYKPTNPPVKDRVNAMNAMFCNANGERKYFVNTDNCPNYTEKLEQQVYNKHGEPEKDGTEDVNDAGGYFVAYKYPIVRPMATQNVIKIGY